MSGSQLRRLVDAQSRELDATTYLADARSDRTVSYAELADGVRCWVAALDERGIPAPANVLLDISDPLKFGVVFVSVIAAGRCAVPVDPNAPPGEKARMRTAVSPDLIVSDDESSAHDVLVDEAGRPDIPTATTAAATRPGALRLHTSGSTGEPKAVQLDEFQLLHVAGQIAEHNRLVPGDHGYNSLPLFHINAEVVGLLATLVGGATLVLDRKFQRTGFWDLITERGITWINAVPALLAILARDQLPSRPEALRFIRSASAPLAASVRAAVTVALGDIVVESYGMTEAASQITATALPPERSPAGSVGRAIGVELRIRAEDGSPVTTGEIGRVWLRGPGVITGYVGGRAAERFDADGWLDTGDLGQLDADGNLTHVGRADDVINRGGELVHPREIEEVLLADDRVLDAVVIGRADEMLGEVPVAFVVTNSAGAELRNDLIARCEQQLSRFKRPAELVFVDDLPRASTGKVLRSEVASS
jgi:oxalate---CoA ligase